MTSESSKRRSFKVFVLTLMGVLVSSVFAKLRFISGDVSTALSLVALVLGLWVAVRLKCPHCGFILSHKFKGAVFLLWAAKDKCPQCNMPL
jgi:hypothetical protein